MRATLPRLAALASLTVCVVTTPVSAQNTVTDAVLAWNRVLQVAVGTTGSLPATTFFTRPYAMMHVAIFDAMNSIDHRYHPWAVRVRALPGASVEAAVAQAAHDVLVGMMPTQRAAFDEALAASMSRLSGDSAVEGARVGAEVAREVLELRADDGWGRTPPQYILPDFPGYWQPTPPQNSQATLTHYPEVVPFAIGSTRQFLMEPPPALTSARYAEDFNETKSVGSVNSTTRSAEQTQMARLWAGVGTTTSVPIVWNNVARDLVRERGLGGLDAARTLALLNMALHDGLLVSFTGKFVYGLWRPVTAIRNADRDGNAATEPDPAWLPLINTPPYPSYPGNMSCLGAAGARTLALLFGRDNIPVSVTWTGAGTAASVTRTYNGLRQLADEEARSRVHGGIHFEFDTLASQGVCTPLAEYVVRNQLRPLFEEQ